MTDRHSLFLSLSLARTQIDAGRQRLSFISLQLFSFVLYITNRGSFFFLLPRVSSLFCTLLLLWGRFVLDTRTASITHLLVADQSIKGGGGP